MSEEKGGKQKKTLWNLTNGIRRLIARRLLRVVQSEMGHDNCVSDIRIENKQKKRKQNFRRFSSFYALHIPCVHIVFV